MFERFTERARRCIFFANQAARQYGGRSIESEFLLLGILREDRNIVRRFVPNLTADPQQKIEQRLSPGVEVDVTGDLPLSGVCKRILAFAFEEAERLNFANVGTEHLLAGILREEQCLAAEILHECGLRLDSIREHIAQFAPSQKPSTPIEPMPGEVLSPRSGPPVFTLDAFESDAISVAKLDPSRHAVFDEVLQRLEQRGQWSRYRPYAVVITNQTDRAVVALTLRWAFTDAAGKTNVHTSRADIFGLPRRQPPIIEPHQQAAYTPVGRIPATLSGVIVGFGSSREPEPSARIVFSIDTAVFEDGYVVGPDESATVASLENRKPAAEQLLQEVRSTVENGRDVLELLMNLRTRVADASPFEREKARFAGQLYAQLRTRGDRTNPSPLDPVMMGLADLPSPPKFFRRE